jgi:hypothetical protein
MAPALFQFRAARAAPYDPIALQYGIGRHMIGLASYLLPKGKAMQFKIAATLKKDLEITIDASSYEEALRIAEEDLITDDFQVIGAEFNLGHIIEITPKNCGACGLFIDKSEEDLNGYHREDLCDANDEIGDK